MSNGGFGVESNTHPHIVFLPSLFLMSFHCIISFVCPPDNNNCFWFLVFWLSHQNLANFLIKKNLFFSKIFVTKMRNSPPKKSNTPQQKPNK